MNLVLAGDVGGTKANIGLFRHGEGRPELEAIESYPSRDAAGLEDLIERFLHKHAVSVSSACFGIAGPVTEGECRTTNLPWIVSEAALRERFKWDRARLVNDLAATAMGVPLLTEPELAVINPGRPIRDGAVGVVAPGTGLGMSLAIVEGGRIHPMASEGGHVDFAPRNELETDLLIDLLKQRPHVSVERLASGPGLFTIYSSLRRIRGNAEPGPLTRRIESGDPPRVITEAALSREDPLCVEALDLFVSIIGAIAGNLALTGLTTGGIYLGGGVPPKILPKLRDGTFMEAFIAKGRFEEFMRKIPVKVILNDRTALLGAAHCALGE
jgi:glucokinase